jgi:predicted aconitase
MKMEECPKFNNCSAPVCPLYTSINEQKYLENERTCYYLIEAQKQGSKTNFDHSGLGELYGVMVRATYEVFKQPDINKHLQKQLLKAAISSSRMARGISLIKKRKSK